MSSAEASPSGLAGAAFVEGTAFVAGTGAGAARFGAAIRGASAPPPGTAPPGFGTAGAAAPEGWFGAAFAPGAAEGTAVAFTGVVAGALAFSAGSDLAADFRAPCAAAG